MNHFIDHEPIEIDLVYADAAHPENIFGAALYRDGAQFWLHRELADIVLNLARLAQSERGAKLVDELIIGVTTNIAKSPMFDDDERIAMVEREVAGIKKDSIRVVGFNSLLMDFAESQGASVIVRGLRAVADFEYEYQMAGMNQQLDDEIETVFLMADVSLQPIASKLVKEIALYGGDISNFVSPTVRDDVVARVEKIGLKGDY